MRRAPARSYIWPIMDLGHAGWVVMVAGTAVICTIAIAASLWILFSLTSDRSLHSHTAVDVLDGSFARGEISAEEYRERRDALDP
jgi:uncharacterized membrane protein